MLDYKKGLHDHGSSDAEGNKNSCVKKYYLATVAIVCFFFPSFDPSVSSVILIYAITCISYNISVSLHG